MIKSYMAQEQKQAMKVGWDSSGRTQPKGIRRIWNWKGYLNHAWHRVQIAI